MSDQIDPAALVKAALERAERACENVRMQMASGQYPEGACFDYEQAIRAIADDPEAVAKIIEQAKGEGDG